jgi:hypothetical protein
MQTNVKDGKKSPSKRPLNETINYEEDRDFPPENDEEKPIYESSEGPIPKIKGRYPNNTGGNKIPPTGKSGAMNMINSGESFGMPNLKSG